MESNEEPLVTVITVVRNSVSLLEETVLSVINQTYRNIEYIVIDGGSNDGTVDIIKKYENRISLWVSEPDNGIYDAMNKGIDFASGTWINFMNSGDRFFNDSVIESIFQTDNHNQYDLIYGDSQYIYSADFSIRKKAGKLKDIWKFMIFFHQSLFMRTGILKKHHFNTSNIAADHELVYKCYNEKLNFLKLDIVIASYLSGGVSERKTVELTMDRWRSVRNITPSVKIDIYYLYFINKQRVRNLLRKYLPEPIKNTIIKLKNYNKSITNVNEHRSCSLLNSGVCNLSEINKI